MHKIVEIKVFEGYKVWIRFEDGIQGTMDLSDLVGEGVFSSWKDPQEFAKVFIDPDTHTLAWPGGIDLAPDALYDDLKAEKAA